ncbi:Malonyl-[acyl-carrier protein] O-methyltransferase [Grimontia celer]|uniref:Malonyl-[acyl-carrier protein] O-methyltransferase n=1 Tax=Grimontia celer TaxID=1796497 RepID=A0A128EZ43_9GAMM|nr:malonyl-ACP O-methyltransferase BioC [Grimontia celer]CZF79276.1 Malonyl-[acyl-carrier protein] O-methyltransferase [Grimontia celer]
MSQAVDFQQDALAMLGEEKKAIKDAFSRAAKTYDSSAAFQRRVGHLLMEMNTDWQDKTVIDLGCGTGYFTKQMLALGADMVALDLSDKMLEQAKVRCGDSVNYISADAESLPLADNSVDVAFSSLALQWCHDLSVPISELKRVVKPGGKILFTTLLEGSLEELKQAWRKVNGQSHVNTFLSHKQVNIALAQAHCNHYHIECKPITEYYPSALALMKDLKGIGATHLQEGRSAGLVGRRAFIELESAYDVYRNEDGTVPATYQVCFGAINNE